MGRLVVEAQGTAATGAAQGVAAAGNSDPLYLVVSVTDADGVPASGLAAAAFDIEGDKPIVEGVQKVAEAITETVQVLSDGNRIVRRTSSRVYRDSEGRTRREQLTSAGEVQNGAYLLWVVPVTYQGTQYTWKLGRYLFFLTVTRGVDHGQTVCAVFVD